FEEFSGGKPVSPKFPLIPYKEAMLKYGSDKPDLRNPLVIADLTEEFNEPSVTFNAFKNLIKAGGVVRAIPAPGAAAQPRSWFDKLNEWARQDMGAHGLGYIVFEADGGKGPIAKFIPADVQARIAAKAGIKAGGAVFFSAGKPEAAAKLAGAARAKIGEDFGLIAKDRFEFCWIVDFPMYEWNEEEKRMRFSHNPFSMPNMSPQEFLALDPARPARAPPPIASGLYRSWRSSTTSSVTGSSCPPAPSAITAPTSCARRLPLPATTRTRSSRNSAACCARSRSARRRTAP